MSKATKVIFSLGTKSALGLFYMTLPEFSIALKKKKKRTWKIISWNFFLLAQS